MQNQGENTFHFLFSVSLQHMSKYDDHNSGTNSEQCKPSHKILQHNPYNVTFNLTI